MEVREHNTHLDFVKDDQWSSNSRHSSVLCKKHEVVKVHMLIMKNSKDQAKENADKETNQVAHCKMESNLSGVPWACAQDF